MMIDPSLPLVFELSALVLRVGDRKEKKARGPGELYQHKTTADEETSKGAWGARWSQVEVDGYSVPEYTNQVTKKAIKRVSYPQDVDLMLQFSLLLP
jgi:hypothetical protein